jgi:small subunit ribosomal protein S7
MPRKGPVAKRPVAVDPVYGSPVVSQLVNKILLDGKKSLAEKTCLWRPRGHQPQDR